MSSKEVPVSSMPDKATNLDQKIDAKPTESKDKVNSEAPQPISNTDAKKELPNSSSVEADDDDGDERFQELPKNKNASKPSGLKKLQNNLKKRLPQFLSKRSTSSPVFTETEGPKPSTSTESLPAEENAIRSTKSSVTSANPNVKGILRKPNPKYNFPSDIEIPNDPQAAEGVVSSMVFLPAKGPTEPNTPAMSTDSLASIQSLDSSTKHSGVAGSATSLIGNQSSKLANAVNAPSSQSAYNLYEEKHVKEIRQNAARNRIKFNTRVIVGETFHQEDYERQGEFIAKQLTPQLAMMIKHELNEFKGEMEVHPESKKNTQFYK